MKLISWLRTLKKKKQTLIEIEKKIKRAKTIVKAYSEGEIEYGKHKDSHLYYQLVNIPEPETHSLLGVVFNFTGSIADNIKIKIDYSIL